MTFTSKSSSWASSSSFTFIILIRSQKKSHCQFWASSSEPFDVEIVHIKYAHCMHCQHRAHLHTLHICGIICASQISNAVAPLVLKSHMIHMIQLTGFFCKATGALGLMFSLGSAPPPPSLWEELELRASYLQFKVKGAKVANPSKTSQTNNTCVYNTNHYESCNVNDE